MMLIVASGRSANKHFSLCCHPYSVFVSYFKIKLLASQCMRSFKKKPQQTKSQKIIRFCKFTNPAFDTVHRERDRAVAPGGASMQGHIYK